MAEIELTYELALEFLSFLRVQVQTEPGDLNLLCLQGRAQGSPGAARLPGSQPRLARQEWQFQAGRRRVRLHWHLRGEHPRGVKFKELGWAHRPSLCLGMHNPWVSEAQRLLKHRGCPEVLVDGDWRTQMSHMVRKFQTDHHLTVDGWVGPETWKALTA
jgi:peptidoglycan hydrolase-like protein with peptidoglycan-binding domain